MQFNFNNLEYWYRIYTEENKIDLFALATNSISIWPFNRYAPEIVFVHKIVIGKELLDLV